MKRNGRWNIGRLAVVACGITAISAHAALGVTTVSFQNRVGGYMGTFDRYISEQGPDFEFNGSERASYLLDGFDAAANSPDEVGLIRFDNMFGNGPGQIPPGARILDAHLQVLTGAYGTSDSGGPYGVAGLLAPFDSNTSYFSSYPPLDPNDPFGGRGPWWQEGHATRPVGGYGAMAHAQIGQARVAALVQQWSDGTLPNHGMAIQAGWDGTSDGWRIATTSYPVAEFRPKLTVTYTTDPVEVNTFQPGVGGYSDGSVTMVRMLSGNLGNEITHDGLDINQGFLDGPDATTEEQLALIKFSNIFGAGAGQAPLDVPVAKGWLVLTTGDSSGNARSRGPFDVHVMQRDWNTTSLYSDFGATPGLQVADGDISPAIDSQFGMITGGEAWFDVTSYLEGVRTGTPDFGLAVLPGTTDGWQIFFNGAGDPAVRPRLVITSGLLSTGPGPVGGDFNADGSVDAADYVWWRKTGGTQAQYNEWRANFGATGAPSPGTQPDVLVHYDFMAKPTAATITAPATQEADGLTAMPLSYGPGINPAGLSNGFSANGWNRGEDAGRDTALANGDYYQFGLTVDAGHEASLSTLDLSLRRSAANAPMNLELHASVDGFATDGILISAFNYFGRTSGTAPAVDPLLEDPFFYMHSDLPGRPDATTVGGDPIPTIDLSVFSELQNLPANTEVTFRLYAWGNASTTATNTLGLGRSSGPMIGGFVVAVGAGQGLAAVPEPSSALLLGLMGMVLAAFGTRRR